MAKTPRHVGTIAHVDTDIGSRVAAVLATKLSGAANSLHERILGVAPPGDSQVLLTRPHDHIEIGNVLARGTSFCFDSGNKIQWEITIPLTGSRWYRAVGDGQSTLAEDTTGYRYADTIPNARLYVTPYIDATRNAEGTGSPCVLRSRLFIVPSHDATLRWYNRTTKTSGATFAITTAGGWYSASVPCKGGIENEIDLEGQSSTAGCLVRVYSAIIAETRHYSQPVSSGSNALTSATRP